jgi:eukaryotic-like serine/threonine-protein kinase
MDTPSKPASHPGLVAPVVHPGQMIGRYRAVAYLGSGGMADVFRCELQGIGGFGKPVVVKRMKPELIEEESYVSMFLDEARLVARLNHPNIVQVFEIDMDRGVPFIAMELVRGPTLGMLLRATKNRTAARSDVIARVIADAALGLAAAHAANDDTGKSIQLVHRDISPQNIMVTAEGVGKILDFGVAKADGKLARTETGVLKGKVAYMAPEQLNMTELDGRADVFALTACLFEVITGRRAFSGRNEVELLRLRLQNPPVRPRDFVPDLPEYLDRILRVGMATDPGQRIRSAAMLHDVLDKHLNGCNYPTDRRALAALIQEVFPDVDSLVAGRPLDGLTTSIPAMVSHNDSSVSGLARPPETTPLPREPTAATGVSPNVPALPADLSLVSEVVPPRRRRGLAMAAAAGLLAVGAVVGVALSRPPAEPIAVAIDEPTPAPASAPVVAAPVVAPDPVAVVAPPQPPTIADVAWVAQPKPVLSGRRPPPGKPSKSTDTDDEAPPAIEVPTERVEVPSPPPVEQPVVQPVSKPPPEPVVESPSPEAPTVSARQRLLVVADLVTSLKQVENDLRVRGHLPASLVNNITAAMGKPLAAKLVGGEAVEVSPSSIYWVVVRGARANKSRAAISAQLASMQSAGQLRGITGL